MKNKKAFRDTSIDSDVLRQLGITSDMSEEEIKKKFLQWMRKEYMAAFEKIMNEN